MTVTGAGNCQDEVTAACSTSRSAHLPRPSIDPARLFTESRRHLDCATVQDSAPLEREVAVVCLPSEAMWLGPPASRWHLCAGKLDVSKMRTGSPRSQGHLCAGTLCASKMRTGSPRSQGYLRAGKLCASKRPAILFRLRRNGEDAGGPSDIASPVEHQSAISRLFQAESYKVAQSR
jgi:hypothetical protein